MADLTALLDGGTSRTRLRIWDGRQVTFETDRLVGARTGRQALQAAVREVLDEACSKAPFQNHPILACGMLGSAVGLAEIAHVPSPVTYRALAHAIRPLHLEGLAELHFIPGVRTAELDVMRGEETEVLGLRTLLNITGPLQVLHLGSHDKCIDCDDQGIQGSMTNLNGELLAALSEHTLLHASVLPLHELNDIDEEAWRDGLEAAREHGLSRAAFLVRVRQVLGGASAWQGSSFLLGALAQANLRLLEQSPEVPVLLYGRAAATRPLARYLQDQGREVRVASERQSELAAVCGAAALLQLRKS